MLSILFVLLLSGLIGGLLYARSYYYMYTKASPIAKTAMRFMMHVEYNTTPSLLKRFFLKPILYAMHKLS